MAELYVVPGTELPGEITCMFPVSRKIHLRGGFFSDNKKVKYTKQNQVTTL